MASYYKYREGQKYWVFPSRFDSYSEVKENELVVWDSATEVRKGDLIFLYMGTPQQH